MTKPKTCWTITDFYPGMQSQVIGLAEAIGLPTTHKICARKWPWGWLGLTIGDPLKQLTQKSHKLTPPWPDLIISCGRRSAPLALAIKKKNQGKTFCVHIQNPMVNHKLFDLIIAPEHDNLKGVNVISTRGAIHKVTQEKIEEGVKNYLPLFKDFPRPYNVVLIGGTTHRYKMPVEAMEDLIKTIFTIRERTEGSILITPSFRTPFRDLLKKRLAEEPNIFLADPEKQNPYLAMLGIADTIFVTDDSVNMLCEACSTGKPIYVLPLLGQGNAKSKRLIQELVQDHIVRPFVGNVESWTYVPFNDTKRIAAMVRGKLEIS